MKVSIRNRRKQSSRKKEKHHSHEYPSNKATIFACIWSPKGADSASSRSRLAPDNRSAKTFARKKIRDSRSTHKLQPGHHHFTEPCSSGLDWQFRLTNNTYSRCLSRSPRRISARALYVQAYTH
jgi:hypothetical protein